MIHFFDILPETIFLMANIFAGMGSGKNTGKLTFKKICGGDGISVTEDAKGITFSLGSITPVALIDPFEIAFGTGAGITSSYFCVTSPDISRCTCRSIFGLRSISRSPYTIGTVDDYSKGSFIVGGNNNSITGNPSNDYGKRSVIIGGSNNTSMPSDNNTITSSVNVNTSSINGIGNSAIMSSYSIKGKVSHGSIISSCDFTSEYTIVNSDISGWANCHRGYKTYSGGSPRMFSSISSNYSCLYSRFDVDYPQCTQYNSIISSRFSNVEVCIPQGFAQNNSIISGFKSNIRSTKVSKKAGGYDYMCVKYSSIISSYNSLNYSGYSSVISSGYSCLIGAGTSICQNNSIISSKCSTLKNTLFGSVIASYSSDIDGDSRDCFRTMIGTIGGINNGSYSSIIGGKYNNISGQKDLSTIIGGYGNTTTENNSVIIGGKYNSTTQFGPNTFALYEPSNRKIQIGGKYNKTNFVTIGGEYNYGYGFSIMIGGKNNKSSYSSKPIYAYGFPYREFHQGRSNGIVIGGRANYTTSSVNSIIIGGNSNRDNNTVNSSIIGGADNAIQALGCFNYYSYTPIQNTVSHNFIIGGRNNSFCGPGTSAFAGKFTMAPYQVKFSGILGGCGNCIIGTSNPYKFGNPAVDAPGLTSSVIVSGNRICSSFNYTMSVEKFLVRGTLKTKTTGGTICTGFSGVVTNPTSITIVNGLITNMS
jgi:hypothetical protein